MLGQINTIRRVILDDKVSQKFIDTNISKDVKALLSNTDDDFFNSYWVFSFCSGSNLGLSVLSKQYFIEYVTTS